MVCGECGSFSAVAKVELLQHVLDVGFDCCFVHYQLLGDLVVAQFLVDQFEYFALVHGQFVVWVWSEYWYDGVAV